MPEIFQRVSVKCSEAAVITGGAEQRIARHGGTQLSAQHLGDGADNSGVQGHHQL